MVEYWVYIRIIDPFTGSAGPEQLDSVHAEYSRADARVGRLQTVHPDAKYRIASRIVSQRTTDGTVA